MTGSKGCHAWQFPLLRRSVATISERAFAMILGMSLATFTTVHVIISLIAIVTGIIVVIAMVGGNRTAAWTVLFLLTTILTSVTGFLFPLSGLTPAVIFGIISLLTLAIALFALYGKHLVGAWRWIYVVTALLALYLNVFVLVVQSFQKLSLLQPLAPTQSEPPFAIAQIVVLAAFVVLGWLAVKRFHPERMAA
jgi:hypothetical protein